MADSQMISFRVPKEVAAALRDRAADQGMQVSDLLRRGTLLVLGKCPTCGQPIPVYDEAGHGDDH